MNMARSSSLSPGGGTVRQLRSGKMSSSCKSLWELEEEELRGFMDLGFSFKGGGELPCDSDTAGVAKAWSGGEEVDQLALSI